jgi:hypothetical protein
MSAAADADDDDGLLAFLMACQQCCGCTEQQEEREKKLCLASQNRRFQTRVRELPGTTTTPIVCPSAARLGCLLGWC